MLHTGLYEQVINTDIDNQLSTRGDAISAITTKIDSAEAPKILSAPRIRDTQERESTPRCITRPQLDRWRL